MVGPLKGGGAHLWLLQAVGSLCPFVVSLPLLHVSFGTEGFLCAFLGGSRKVFTFQETGTVALVTPLCFWGK